MSTVTTLGVELSLILAQARQEYAQFKSEVESNPPRVTVQTTNPTGAPGTLTSAPATTANATAVTTFGGQSVLTTNPVAAAIAAPPLPNTATPVVTLPPAAAAAQIAQAYASPIGPPAPWDSESRGTAVAQQVGDAAATGRSGSIFGRFGIRSAAIAVAGYVRVAEILSRDHSDRIQEQNQTLDQQVSTAVSSSESALAGPGYFAGKLGSYIPFLNRTRLFQDPDEAYRGAVEAQNNQAAAKTTDTSREAALRIRESTSTIGLLGFDRTSAEANIEFAQTQRDIARRKQDSYNATGFNSQAVQNALDKEESAANDKRNRVIGNAVRENNIKVFGIDSEAGVSDLRAAGLDFDAGRKKILDEGNLRVLADPHNRLAIENATRAAVGDFDSEYTRRTSASVLSQNAEARANELQSGGFRGEARQAAVTAKFLGEAGVNFVPTFDKSGNVTSFRAVDATAPNSADLTSAINRRLVDAQADAANQTKAENILIGGSIAAGQLRSTRQPLDAQIAEINSRFDAQLVGKKSLIDIANINTLRGQAIDDAKRSFGDESKSIGVTLTAQGNALQSSLARQPAAAANAFLIGAAGENEANDLFNSGRPDLAAQSYRNTISKLALTQQDYLDGFRGVQGSRLIETQGGRQSEDPSSVTDAIAKATQDLLNGLPAALQPLIDSGN